MYGLTAALKVTKWQDLTPSLFTLISLHLSLSVFVLSFYPQAIMILNTLKTFFLTSITWTLQITLKHTAHPSSLYL